uniref:Acetyltransferase n=1 Tax=Oryza barthii TaxID=65489 RepID=A0A0D3HK15_9ORYZ
MASSPVRVVSTRTVKPPPRPRERIPLTSWDVAMLSANYIQKGLLFAPPHSSSSALLSTTADVVPPDADVPCGLVHSFFPLRDAVNYDGHHLPLFVVQVTELVDGGVFLGFISPRFDMYGCDFGWGKAVAARSGKANKSDGKASLYPARDGGGGVDAEVVLAPEHMAALELDGEFWAAVTPDHVLRACSSTKA